MKQICVFLLFVTAVLGKPSRYESPLFQISADGSCKDEQTCAYCANNRHRCGDDSVKKVCRRSCGLCPGACQDNARCSSCNFIKDQGLCKIHAFSKDCRFTCNICTEK